MRELRLGEEDAPERDAIAAADERAFRIPDLEGMAIAGIVEGGVGAHDLRRDPGHMPAPLAPSGAGLDDGLEATVEGDAIAALAHQAADAPRHVQLVEEQHAARGRRTPGQRSEMAGREQAAPVGGDHGRDRHIVHDSGEPLIVERAFGIGQPRIRRHQVLGPEPQEGGQVARALWLERPQDAERDSLGHLDRGLAKQVGAQRGDFLGGNGKDIGVDHGNATGLFRPHKTLEIAHNCGIARQLPRLTLTCFRAGGRGLRKA